MSHHTVTCNEACRFRLCRPATTGPIHPKVARKRVPLGRPSSARCSSRLEGARAALVDHQISLVARRPGNIGRVGSQVASPDNAAQSRGPIGLRHGGVPTNDDLVAGAWMLAGRRSRRTTITHNRAVRATSRDWIEKLSRGPRFPITCSRVRRLRSGSLYAQCSSDVCHRPGGGDA